MIKLKNNHTGKTYEVSEQEYKKMQDAGTAGLFTKVETASAPKESTTKKEDTK